VEQSKKRIILVGPAYPLRGGIAHFNESFCRSLMAAGCEAEILSFYMQYPDVLFPGKSQKSSGKAPADLKIHNLLSSINPLSWRNAARKIVRMKPDMVVIRFWLPFMGPALGSLARALQKKGIKVVGLVDNAIPHEARPMDKALSNWFFKHCDAFFTLSGSVASDLQRLAPGKPVETSPHPLYDVFGQAVSKDEARKNLGLNPDRRYLLFFGFVRAYKGLDLLLDAMGDDRVRELNLRLIVAGEFYESREKYDELIEGLELTENIEIRSDYIPDEDVKYYFCASNLVAQTYKSATQSGVTQIAYHFNRPMLVTDVGGLAEIVPDGKVGYVTPKEPKAIAEAIVRFFEENREDEFSKEAERRKSRFSWEHFTQKFLSFAEKLN
jgi:glycosyltransferase involved in cell wall biosynthesis